jgi:hypothetical protein
MRGTGKISSTRKFGGKRYRLTADMGRPKHKAQRGARTLRSTGHNVRVVKGCGGYNLYVR